MHDRVRSSDPRDGDDPGRARLTSASRAEALGRRQVGRSCARSSSPGSKEQRYPTRDELDQAAPQNPVLFSTGPGRLAQLAGAEAQRHRQGFQARRPGKVEKDPRTGEPTGILRNCTRYVKAESPRAQADRARPGTAAARAVQATTTRSASRASSTATRIAPAIDRYRRLHEAGEP